MTFKHYDVVRAASPSDLAEKLTHKLKEGWQPFGSPVAITPYTLMQAITAEGDVVVSGATEPDWYYVIVLAGQSNAMAYGEGLPLPDSYDAPDPRIKQLARRSVQDMSTLNHPKADLSKGQYGCVGQGLHIAKKLLPYIPNNAGILLVPCCRGGSAFTLGAEGTFSADTGASQDSARWGVGKPLYQDLIVRTKAALQKNQKNVLLAVCWMQGEFDMSAATYAQQPALFTAMLKQFRADLTVFNAQCHGGSAVNVPWICGDTTYYWKNTYGTQYNTIYGAYKNRESEGVYFVPFMTDGNGVNTATNVPAEDPDIPASGYYGAASRTNGNQVSSNRPTHFSSWARRSIISDRLATAILNAAGRTSAFISGKAPEINPSPGGDTPSGPSDSETSVRTVSLLPADGEAATQGWTIKDGGIQLADGVFKITKQSNKTWSLAHPVDDAITLLTQGGRLTCKFRLSGALTNNQFGLGIYLYTDAPVPDGVAMTGTGNPFLMSYFTQTTDGRVNLMHHRKAGNTKLGEFGGYSNDWQTLELVFTAGSATVTPKLNGVAGPAFQVIKDSLTLGLNALTLTDVTKNAAYGVEIESLVLEINAPAA
ncbi:SASA family carbohydrate esterase [Escherichia coli]|uniref:SASA family carbohydrate esterase n=1 Tax=Escherichia coli TaxID=562 RepID=UPI0010CBE754|nr:SASA family carbohydrate esterase [Escherichia coli]